MTRTERMSRNFIATHGKRELRRFLRDTQDGKSGQVMADRLGVCRERVRQWKNAFGVSVSVFTPYSEIQAIVDEDLGGEDV